LRLHSSNAVIDRGSLHFTGERPSLPGRPEGELCGKLSQRRAYPLKSREIAALQAIAIIRRQQFLENSMSATPKEGATVVELKAKDLPAYCPNPAMPLWSSHPRVFLDLAHDGQATCAYCGTHYKLAAGEVVKGH
jgi:uncharacterized Zn-finger protein